jgi:hypothetical protein
MLLRETHPQPAAAHALTAAIESMEPSAATLESHAFAFQLAQYLAAVIKSGTPDIAEMKLHGWPLETAVAVASAVAARHARRAEALEKMQPNAAAPAAPSPAPKSEQLDAMSGMSMLHTLMQEVERPGRQACLTTLCNSGWSLATARELKTVIDRSKEQ